MNWKVAYLPEAEKDLKDLDGSQRLLVLKAIKKVSTNPLPMDEATENPLEIMPTKNSRVF